MVQIQHLTPYIQTNFTILIYVLKMTRLREYGSSKRTGKIISLILMDEIGSEMKASGFDEIAESIHQKMKASQ
jgi:hypothetical protein